MIYIQQKCHKTHLFVCWYQNPTSSVKTPSHGTTSCCNTPIVSRHPAVSQSSSGGCWCSYLTSNILVRPRVPDRPPPQNLLIGSFPFHGENMTRHLDILQCLFQVDFRGFLFSLPKWQCFYSFNIELFVCIRLFALTKRLNMSPFWGPLQILPSSLLGKNTVPHLF